jgi:hypothetical protein
MSQAHLCFYSARSRYCSEFLEALAASPYSREFRFICVDALPGGGRPALPPYVRSVPTLMIVGEGEPRIDGRVMDWLMERRLRDRDSVAAPGPGARMGTTAAVSHAGPASGGAGAMSGGPAAFSSDMMGFGDEGFSFIGEDAAADKGATSRMIGNMASLNELHMLSMSDSRAGASFAIMGAGAGGERSGHGVAIGDSGGGRGPKVSEKSKALDDAYARMLAERDSGMPGGPKPGMNPFGSGRR